MSSRPKDAEAARLREDDTRARNWKRWEPYLSERQWGTVREDYSADGDSREYFPHDQAGGRAYRWGEDGLLRITDRECRLCFALALWNGRDPILKERLFGLTGRQGNHGEDVKEQYFYLDSSPTHFFMKALYEYPQAEFPYDRLLEENARRGRQAPEFTLVNTGVFDHDRHFDVFAEYAKASPNDILIRVTVANLGPEAATLHLLPTLWFRNTWSWGRDGEGYWPRPSIGLVRDGTLETRHAALVAAGTGLGEAGLYWGRRSQRPFATEGEHTSFSPSSQVEIGLLQHLLERLEEVSWERVLSGPGLVNIYSFLRDSGRAEEPPWLADEISSGDPAAVISTTALAGRSRLCSEALDLFVTLYGAEAGNLALKVMATGGVYVGGGIAPRILPRLRGPAFVASFLAKGRMRPLLEAMPVRVVLNDRLALIGAARHATRGA